jgi:hypothetical protein
MLALLKAVGKIQIGGRVVDGIGIENHQPIHLARVEIGNQRLEIAKLIAGQRNRRLGTDKTVLPTLPSALLMASASEATDGS